MLANKNLLNVDLKGFKNQKNELKNNNNKRSAFKNLKYALKYPKSAVKNPKHDLKKLSIPFLIGSTLAFF